MIRCAVRALPRMRSLVSGVNSGSTGLSVFGGRQSTTNVLGRSIADLPVLRAAQRSELDKLVETKQRNKFFEQLGEEACPLPESHNEEETLESAGITSEEMMQLVTAGITTFLLHKESRYAAFLGHGFYTIGPCGEELLGAVGLCLRPTDASALHYRHLSTSIVRQLRSGKSIEQIIEDRARGYVVSSLDPVTGGRHCCLGGSEYDFVVTSTLASQAPPAVGRALGSQLAAHINVPSPFPSDSVSYVSVGDGSVNNAHFLSATNLADYVKYRSFRCPVVFGISDNNICISLPGHNWLQEFKKKLRMQVFQCDGTNVLDVYKTAKKAFEYSRKNKAPSCLIFSNLTRRFGHAATDRQDAYLTKQQIEAAAEKNPLQGLIAQAVSFGVTDYPSIQKLFVSLEASIQDAFDRTSLEPKISSRQALIDSNSPPLAVLDPATFRTVPSAREFPPPKSTQPIEVMRKNMNRVIDDTLASCPQAVYIGEDVTHGGYYLVTEGLAKKYPFRVADFPPDETSLVGAAIGYAQSGLLPILEIPYAKYLDCGGDMFFEAAIYNWLSNGQQPVGMLVRLQGFDRGVFGGNFHTHNILHLPPGVDVVCYSNGADYVRGFRYNIQQALKGRLVMSVDSTNLLNLRHVVGSDDAWRKPFPEEGEVLSWDQVMTYGSSKKLAIVTYGNGVVTALQAKHELMTQHGLDDFTIIDSPYLSAVPQGLKDIIGQYEKVIFADVCKQSTNPLASFACQLQNEGLLPPRWKCIAASNTYNPLGSVITFLNTTDIIDSVLSLRS